MGSRDQQLDRRRGSRIGFFKNLKHGLSKETGRLKRGIATICVTALMLTSLAGDQLYGRAEAARTISIYNIHTKETLTVIYKRDGKYIPSAMKKVNHIMRDWRRNEPRVMRPDLVDLMWEVHNQLGSRKPIYLISGYRSAKTNNKLRKTRGGQAKKSRHILGMAADVHFPDVPVRELRDSALIRQRGGVGYYPTSGLPFVHMDVGRVRHWPRLARPQLAALFPNGRSKHVPSDGRPLTKSDAIKYGAAKYVAKLRKTQLARRQLRDGSSGIAVASLTPPPPSRKQPAPLKDPYARKDLNEKIAALETKSPLQMTRLPEGPPAPPKAPEKTKPPEAPWWRNNTIAGLEPLETKIEEERELVQLASIDTSMPKHWQTFSPPKKPEIIEKANVAYSPEVDDEHPDELNYRPFSLSPLMTDKSVAEDQELAKLSPPDYAQTSVILSDQRSYESARFRPGLQYAHLRWANQFIGKAVGDLAPRK